MITQNTVDLGTFKLFYETDYANRKNCYLAIKDGKLTVRAPLWFTIERVEQILAQKQQWIKRKLEQCKMKSEGGNAANAYLLGILYPVKTVIAEKTGTEWAGNEIRLFFNKRYLKTDGFVQKQSKALDAFYKNYANRILPERLEALAEQTGLHPAKLTIRKAGTRWGSCTSKGNISINQNVIKYPYYAVDYVLLHELCHLKYMNHQKPFWTLVEKYMPDYKERRKLLKKVLDA